MGETCGLKLVFETHLEQDVCRLCKDLEKKQRRYDKMYRDVQRWEHEGNRVATIDRTQGDMRTLERQIDDIRESHAQRLQSLSQETKPKHGQPRSKEH